MRVPHPLPRGLPFPPHRNEGNITTDFIGKAATSVESRNGSVASRQLNETWSQDDYWSRKASTHHPDALHGSSEPVHSDPFDDAPARIVDGRSEDSFGSWPPSLPQEIPSRAPTWFCSEPFDASPIRTTDAHFATLLEDPFGSWTPSQPQKPIPRPSTPFCSCCDVRVLAEKANMHLV